MKKALVLALVAVFALSAVSFAADVSGSLEAKYEFGVSTDEWKLLGDLKSGLPTSSELKLKVADEGWAFDLELRDVLAPSEVEKEVEVDVSDGEDGSELRTDTITVKEYSPSLRLIKATLNDPAVSFTAWANGKETSDKKDPLEFVKSGKKADSAKYRLEASVFGVNTAFDFDSGREYLYGFVDTAIDGHKLGLAYLSDLTKPVNDDSVPNPDLRKRTVVLFGDTSFQGAKVKVAAGMTFGEKVDKDNVMYGADVEVPVPVYEGVSIQGKWRVAQQEAFTSGFTANHRVAEGYVKYGEALMQGKAGVKGTNLVEGYDKDQEELEYIAEFTLKEFADGPGFDDVIDDYDLLTGYAVKAKLSKTGGKVNEDKSVTNIFLGAGSRFAEGLNAKLAVDYSKGEEKANVLETARKGELQKVLGDAVTLPLATNYGSGYTLEAEVTYALGNGITLVPGASFEKYAGGKDDDDDDVAEWVSVSSIGSEVNYALSSNVTLLSELVYEVAKVDGEEEDGENKAMKAMFGVKVSF